MLKEEALGEAPVQEGGQNANCLPEELECAVGAHILWFHQVSGWRLPGGRGQEPGHGAWLGSVISSDNRGRAGSTC